MMTPPPARTLITLALALTLCGALPAGAQEEAEKGAEVASTATEPAAPVAVFAPKVDFQLHTMSKGSYPALVVEVEGADDRLAAGVWSDLMKEYGAKPKRSRPEKYRSEEAVISSVGGSDPMNVYADFQERGADVQVMVWMEVAEGQFLSDATGGTRSVDNARSLLQEYALQVRREAINKEVDAERKSLAKLERKLRDLERDLAGYERDIERARQAIERAEANIVENARAQEESRIEVERQSANVQAVQAKLEGVKG